ncbi:MAG: 6-pyruvoyl-tetrahydropterin synthase-related protein, partial [Anaerolineae bacterium]|nr:6-pyruvoyl-tetrahydropterin synthase-related protein [Anaerolineae bacterium]
WWPRWSPDFSFGYGYPLFNLYAPLAFYAAEVLHLLGLGLISSVKTVYILATIGAGLSMYGFARRLFGPQAGLLAGVVYMYAPFHLVDMFVRSAYAEFVALALVPAVFWAFTELISTPSPRRLGWAGFAYGLLLLTHHTTFYTFNPLLMVYIFYLILAKARLNLRPLVRHGLYALGGGLLGLALGAIYLLPLTAEMRFIKLEQWTSGSYNYLQHFVYPAQFFSPAWGYGYAGPGPLDDFSFQLGAAVIVLFCGAVVRLLTDPIYHRGTAIFFFISSLVTIMLMLPLAEAIWQIPGITTFASLVQFPWRLLGMVAFSMSIVAGSLVAESRIQPASERPAVRVRNQFSTPLYVLSIVVISASFSYTVPEYTTIPPWADTPLAVVNWDRASIADRVGMVSVTEEQPQTSPMEAEYLASGRPTTVAGIISGQGQVETLYHGGASDRVRVLADSPVTLQFYTYHYPGWQVSSAGQTIPHRPEPPFGLITVDLPPGDQIVELRMGTTPSRLAGSIISGVTLVIIVFLLSPLSARLTYLFDN